MRSRFLSFLVFSACLPFAVKAQNASFAPGVPVNVATEKRAWMGVSVAPAPASLRHQLKTPDGIGLVIAFVQPKSPADDAGLKPYDLLLKLDDQWLVNPEQFAVLVRMHHAGDQVKLSFVREGAEQSAAVKLIEHEVPKAREFDGMFPWPNDVGAGHPVQMHAPAWDPDHARDPMMEAEKVVTWLDGGKQVSIVTSHGHSTLDVKENESGRQLFSGPIDTDEQRKNLPPDIRSKLDSLSKIASEFEGKSNSRNEGEKPAAPKEGDPRQPDESPSR
jgi:hypothetical protein